MKGKRRGKRREKERGKGDISPPPWLKPRSATGHNSQIFAAKNKR